MNLQDPARGLARLREPYARIASEFLGPLDGTAVERTIDELLRVARRPEKA